jgi:hypothetical protein
VRSLNWSAITACLPVIMVHAGQAARDRLSDSRRFNRSFATELHDRTIVSIHRWLADPVASSPVTELMSGTVQTI